MLDITLPLTWVCHSVLGAQLSGPDLLVSPQPSLLLLPPRTASGTVITVTTVEKQASLLP